MILLRPIGLVFAIAFFGINSFAQSPALVSFDDLKFNSGFEREAFSGIQRDSIDYLSLFLAVSPSSDKELRDRISKRIQLETEKISQKKFEKLKDEKKVERVFELINGDVLIQYREETLFPELLSSGNFNCLTASAFYGFIFSNLGVSFEFKESANHVHPVAFPGTLQIKVETTDPIFGFQYFDAKLKVQFVNYLVFTKKISKEEAKSVSADDIFNKYYFPDSSIGMRELAGLQYLNDAFYNFGKSNFNYAFQQIQKAYCLYPSDRVSTVMLFLLSWCIAETDYTEVQDASFLAFASRFVGKGLELEMILLEYRNLTEKVLMEKSQVALYDQIYFFLMDAVEIPDVRKAIEKEYYFQRGRMLLSTFRVKESLTYFETALSVDPNDPEVQAFCVQSIAYTFSTSSNQEIVNMLEEFELRFPVMQNNESFISLQMLGYLQLGEERFDFDQPAEGEVLLKKFENLFHLHPGISIHYEKVGDAYSAAAVYYFKRNNKAAARDYLNRGLQFSPENHKLMYRLRAL